MRGFFLSFFLSFFLLNSQAVIVRGLKQESDDVKAAEARERGECE